VKRSKRRSFAQVVKLASLDTGRRVMRAVELND